jgi:hypothetical protein
MQTTKYTQQQQQQKEEGERRKNFLFAPLFSSSIVLMN